jgi:hypothetical protein
MRRLIRGYDYGKDAEVQISRRDLKQRCEEVKRKGGRVARIGGDLTLFVRNAQGDQERLAEYYDKDPPAAVTP